MDILKIIKKCIEETFKMLKDEEYLEKNYRTLLANELRYKDLEVHEEVIVPYTIESSGPIPIGYGHCDIVVMYNGEAIILELKINKKNCDRQLKKYMENWWYCILKCGFCVNFYIGGYSITKHEAYV